MQAAVRQSSLPFALLIVLNLVPVVGVLHWGWQSFDLIFLYWLENLVIGFFTLARMLVRPYGHGLELIFPLFIAPFFALHYGGFCWGHGTFVVSMFGPEALDGFNLLPTTLSVLSSPVMLFALTALAFIQLLDWLRDVRQRGFGADSVVSLMVRPYRRIVVLHLTILAAGFALAALDEPLLGLVILIGVKTASDVWHWRKDDALDEMLGDSAAEFSEEEFAKIAAEYPRPMVTVNGEEKHFASFAEMKDSKEFRMAMALMRIIGGGKQLKLINAYMESRIEEERGATV